MPATEHWIEYAKSGRSKCKRCKETIEKAELRIVADAYSETRDMHFTSSYHPSCFKVPPVAMAGVTPEEFVENNLADKTHDEVLQDEVEREEIIAAISVTTNGGKKKKAAKKKKGEEEEDTKVAKKAKKAKKEVAERSPTPELAAESPAAVQDEWVGCDKCEKWRKLPPGMDPEALPEEWFCSMNTWDANFASCDAPQEEGA